MSAVEVAGVVEFRVAIHSRAVPLEALSMSLSAWGHARVVDAFFGETVA